MKNESHPDNPQILKGNLDRISADLEGFFQKQMPIVLPIGQQFTEFVEELVAYVLRGGKRLRPTFAWLGWLGAGGESTGSQADAVHRACSALELVQACALIHDDIIDSSDTRRGSPTMHIHFSRAHEFFNGHGSSADYGRSAAILIGDLALAWADDMFQDSGVTSEARSRASYYWSAMRTEVLGGQILDIHAEATRDNKISTAIQISRYKTAAYTVERPLQLGGSFAGADAKLMDAYHHFGVSIGVAFQLRDDILGVFGDPQVTGKPSGDDLREGKRTELISRSLALAETKDTRSYERLQAAIGSQLTEGDIEELRQVIADLGAVGDIEKRITTLRSSALAVLAETSMVPEIRQELERIADLAIHRLS